MAVSALTSTTRENALDVWPVLNQIDSANSTLPRGGSLQTRSNPYRPPGVERYWAVLGVLNGWPERPLSVPAFQWFSAALAAQ